MNEQINIHQKLIDKCKKGDKMAQYEIYKLYYKAMYNTAVRIINHSAEAEDVMQDSFLSAFRKIDSYKNEVSFGAWLKRIVINNSIDALRKKEKNKITDDIESVSTSLSFEEDNFNHEAEKNKELLITKIKETINKLPDGYRIIISLYLLEGYDHDEIGEIMNITASTSRSQFTRAKRKLQELLELSNIKPNHYEQV